MQALVLHIIQIRHPISVADVNLCVVGVKNVLSSTSNKANSTNLPKPEVHLGIVVFFTIKFKGRGIC